MPQYFVFRSVLASGDGSESEARRAPESAGDAASAAPAAMDDDVTPLSAARRCLLDGAPVTLRSSAA
jgi:hypothetical protein